MNRIGTFFLGFLIGAVTIYAALHYHIVRTHGGVELIPKVTSTLSETYVDIRDFGFQEWSQHQTLAAAIAHAGKAELLQGAVTQPLQDAVGGVLEQLDRR
jgi:hypothetical protein